MLTNRELNRKIALESLRMRGLFALSLLLALGLTGTTLI